MISTQQFLCLLLLAYPICCYTAYDRVTLSSSSLEELSQTQLSTQNSEVLEWGSTASDIYKCVNLSDQYFDSMGYDQTISKTLTGLSPHNNVYVTFDIVFLNIANPNVIKHGQIDIDGTAQSFDAKTSSSFYNCMPRNGSTSVDGKNSVAYLFSHSNSSMTISIKPTDLGSKGRFGVSNLNIYLAKCGSNASFDASTKRCSCNPGHKQVEVKQGSPGHVYGEKKCVAQQ